MVNLGYKRIGPGAVTNFIGWIQEPKTRRHSRGRNRRRACAHTRRNDLILLKHRRDGATRVKTNGWGPQRALQWVTTAEVRFTPGTHKAIRGTIQTRNKAHWKTPTEYAQPYGSRHGVGNQKRQRNVRHALCRPMQETSTNAYPRRAPNDSQKPQKQHQIDGFKDALLQYICAINYASTMNRED